MSIIIDKVRISNFRSLKDIEVKLSPSITLLVGANNAGKTTFLRALNIAINAKRRYFLSQDDLFIDKEGNQLAEGERVIMIDVKVIPANSATEFDTKWARNFGSNIKRDNNNIETLSFRTKIDLNTIHQEYQIERYIITNWESNQVNESDELTADLSGIPFYFIDAQRDLQGDLGLRTSDFGQITSKIKYENDKTIALETELEKLNKQAVEESEVLRVLVDNLKKLNETILINNSGQGVEITPFPKKVRDLHKGMKIHFQDGGSDAFSLEYHGMGTRSWASLLTFKAKIEIENGQMENDRKPYFPVLGLEEPEAHLHPNAQRQVYEQLSAIKGQKIISTHSPYIAAQADLSELRHFQKETDKTIANQLNIDDLNSDELHKIKREVILSRGEILFSRAIILFEGETESQCLPIFARKYWGKEPFSLGVTMLSVGGNNFKPYLLLAEAMQIPWFIFSDYDNELIRKELDKHLSSIGLVSEQTNYKVIKLEKSIEKYLIEEGYQLELKSGINAYCLANIEGMESEQKSLAMQNKINNYSDEALLNELTSKSNRGKTRYPSFWAEEIVSLSGERSIPTKMRQLFDAVNAKIMFHSTNTEENAST